MPQYIKYEKRAGGYIIARTKGATVTYELTPRAETIIAMHGIKDGNHVTTALLSQLRKMGDAFTGGAPPASVPESTQPELPLS